MKRKHRLNRLQKWTKECDSPSRSPSKEDFALKEKKCIIEDTKEGVIENKTDDRSLEEALRRAREAAVAAAATAVGQEPAPKDASTRISATRDTKEDDGAKVWQEHGRSASCRAPPGQFVDDKHDAGEGMNEDMNTESAKVETAAEEIDPLDAFMEAEILPEVAAKEEEEKRRHEEEHRELQALLQVRTYHCRSNCVL